MLVRFHHHIANFSVIIFHVLKTINILPVSCHDMFEQTAFVPSFVRTVHALKLRVDSALKVQVSLQVVLMFVRFATIEANILVQVVTWNKKQYLVSEKITTHILYHTKVTDETLLSQPKLHSILFSIFGLQFAHFFQQKNRFIIFFIHTMRTVAWSSHGYVSDVPSSDLDSVPSV